MSKKHKHHVTSHVLDLESKAKKDDGKSTGHTHRRSWPIFSITAFVILLGSGFLFNYTYSDRFFPGVTIADMPVGGKTFAEVIYHFTDGAKVLADTGIQLNLLDGGTTKEVTIPMSAVGLTPDRSFEYFSLGDWEATVRQAYAFGRTGSAWQRFREQTRLILGKRFDLPATIYEGAVRSFLSRELELFLKKTEPARFAVDTKGTVSIVPEKIGERMDLDAIILRLAQKVSSLDGSSENLKAEIDIPQTTAAKLAPFLGLAEEISKKTTLLFRYKTYAWKVSGATLASWLAIKDGNTLGINDSKLETYLSKTVALIINDPPQNSRFKMQDGALVEITPGKSGSVVDIAKTAEKVELMLPDVQESFAAENALAAKLATLASDVEFNAATGTISIPVVVATQEPKVTKETIDRYRITELVGSSRTSFKGSSADRVTNITVGAATLNGFLIAPGQEFSAVDTIGYVNEEAGYTKEYVIKDNKSVKEFGGGLCQLATTLFRLALNAGLPITERAAHRYVVGYYGPGLDATIYGPHPDLRFVNDTGEYLLMQSRIEGTDLVLELYGQKDGRQVSIGEPVLSDHLPAPATRYVPTTDLPQGVEQCSETPRAGVTALVTYQVAYESGKINEQHFKSIYQPWQKICLVGILR